MLISASCASHNERKINTQKTVIESDDYTDSSSSGAQEQLYQQ